MTRGRGGGEGGAALDPPPVPPQREGLPPRLDVDIHESPTQFEIDASCPGVAKEDVTLEVDPARHELYIRVAKAGRDEKDHRVGLYQVRRACPGAC